MGLDQKAMSKVELINQQNETLVGNDLLKRGKLCKTNSSTHINALL